MFRQFLQLSMYIILFASQKFVAITFSASHRQLKNSSPTETVSTDYLSLYSGGGFMHHKHSCIDLEPCPECDVKAIESTKSLSLFSILRKRVFHLLHILKEYFRSIETIEHMRIGQQSNEATLFKNRYI